MSIRNLIGVLIVLGAFILGACMGHGEAQSQSQTEIEYVRTVTFVDGTAVTYNASDINADNTCPGWNIQRTVTGYYLEGTWVNIDQIFCISAKQEMPNAGQ
ncbi:MAG: hypothetical protein KAS32_24855 [Candidatus Peribacteraceae bacterium]|nr:hypothetical protein [Candidatus Peribacteraceae bacterium]